MRTKETGASWKMVFYDISGTRKRYVWATLIVIFCAIAAYAALAYADLAYAPSTGTPTYDHPVLNDPRFSKTIALTFDDGPDPIYTPELIKLLMEENVPATFFMIGENVVKNPKIAKMVVDSGFEIGNHTFTHSENVQSNENRIRNELISTDRVIREATLHSTRLFRPPYLEDINVGTIDGGEIDDFKIQWAEKAGYIVVGANVDTQDWNVQPGESDVILQRLGERLHESGPNVIIMHDFAGEGASIEALRTFIPTMKEQGYTFVLVSDYFDLTRDETMPYTPVAPTMDHVFVSAAKVFVHGATSFNVLVALISLIALTRMWTIVALRKIYVPLLTRNPKSPKERIPFTVLIPAYNEEANISATIQSVFRAIQPQDEVIVIDDGSTDSTPEMIRALISQYGPQLVLLQKENGGTKGGALAYGTQYASREFLICIDADTVIDPEAFTQLVRHFSDASVGAVCGKIYPIKARSLLSIFQYLEYMQGQNLDKEVVALGNGIGVVPGALGAWRKKAVLASGGIPLDTVVEDQDLTLALLANGWKVRYERKAIAYTETPATLKSFFKQRSRWVFGTVQCAWKYRHWMFSRSRPALGWIALPNIVLFNIFLPLLVPLLDGALIIGLFGWIDLRMLIGPFIIFAIFDMWCTMESLAYERESRYAILPLLIWQRFFYRYMMAGAIIKSLVHALHGSFMGWGHLKRTGDCQTMLDDMIAAPTVPLTPALQPVSISTAPSQ